MECVFKCINILWLYSERERVDSVRSKKNYNRECFEIIFKVKRIIKIKFW